MSISQFLAKSLRGWSVWTSSSIVDASILKIRVLGFQRRSKPCLYGRCDSRAMSRHGRQQPFFWILQDASGPVEKYDVIRGSNSWLMICSFRCSFMDMTMRKLHRHGELFRVWPNYLFAEGSIDTHNLVIQTYSRSQNAREPYLVTFPVVNRIQTKCKMWSS